MNSTLYYKQLFWQQQQQGCILYMSILLQLEIKAAHDCSTISLYPTIVNLDCLWSGLDTEVSMIEVY